MGVPTGLLAGLLKGLLARLLKGLPARCRRRAGDAGEQGRDLDVNRRAAPRSAVHAHRAPVPLDDRRDDRQPQARSPRLAVAGGVRPIEAPEDLLHILVGDSRTVVAHLDDGDGPGVLAGGRRGMRGGTPPRRCPHLL